MMSSLALAAPSSLGHGSAALAGPHQRRYPLEIYYLSVYQLLKCSLVSPMTLFKPRLVHRQNHLCLPGFNLTPQEAFCVD